MQILTNSPTVFISHPFDRQENPGPVLVACVFSWITVVLATAVLVANVNQMSIWGSVCLLVVIGFGIYTALVTYEWAKEDDERYEIALDGDVVRLTSHDELLDTTIRRQIWLRDVVRAHLYQRRGTHFLILRAPRKFLEIPLSSFGSAAEKQIIAYIAERGVHIGGLPSPMIYLRGSAETILSQ